MKEKIKFEAGAYFMTNALRQLGYTNYTAIADIIDNSLESEVGSKNINIDLIRDQNDKKLVSQIKISDDGCGMDYETLRDCMRLGSRRTGKDFLCLGVYGAGLKTSALSFGRRLEVLTKEEEGKLLQAILDIDNINEENDSIDVSFAEFDDDSEEYKAFNMFAHSNHGTVITISKLDRIQNKDLFGFERTLSRKLRIIFNKFIESGDCALKVNGKKLTFFDTIGNKSGQGTELLDEGDFTYNDSVIQYKAWHVPTGVQSTDFDDAFGRGNQHLGIYVYRQQRLVGEALDFEMCGKKSHWSNGFRFELFMDGSADAIFGTTFTKMINERDKSGIEQGFYDKLKSIVQPLVNQVINVAKKAASQKTEKVSEETKKILERTTEILNKNKLLANTVKQKGENNKPNNPKPKNPNPKPQENPNPTRKRVGKWTNGYEFVSEGDTGFMYETIKREGKSVVLINQDHAFYERIFSKLDDEGKYNMAIYLACEYPALSNSDYYTDYDAEKYIKSYKSCYSDAVRRAFI